MAEKLPDAGTVVLSAAEFQALLDAVEHPEPPTPRLVAAMQQIPLAVAKAMNEAGVDVSWLDKPCPALSPTYARDITPRRVLDSGNEEAVLEVLAEIASGTFSL